MAAVPFNAMLPSIAQNSASTSATFSGTKRANAPLGDPLLVGRWKRSLADPKAQRQLWSLLQRTLLFVDCAEEIVSAICDVVWPVVYSANQIVWRQGDLGQWMGIVISGKVEKTIHRHNLEIDLGATGCGHTIGEIGFFGLQSTRSFTVTVTAAEPATLLVLTHEAFVECMKLHGGSKAMPAFSDAQAMQRLLDDQETFFNLKCFDGLDRDFVGALRDHSEPRLCFPKQFLMRENEYGDEMYVLRSGQVRVERNGATVVELGSRADPFQGIVLGDIAVLGSDKRRTATVVCTSLCLIRVVHGADFHRLLAEFPSAKRLFDHRFIARLVNINLQEVNDERKHYDSFLGSVSPKTTTQMRDLLAKHDPNYSPRVSRPDNFQPLKDRPRQLLPAIGK
eukprot:TRINITY_DN38242_c0_g1_i1.p1 TRINITY_DN38242_c0_g1~~TRINITY_DN38242_c0_g1_i1.p1  ORF type:complete len:394 (-),score=65.68 TRINITY_DN38242_c0_g1_i1:49-1230(-)